MARLVDFTMQKYGLVKSGPDLSKKLLDMHYDTTLEDAMGHTLTVGGNAVLSNAQSKFGGYSAKFDGSGDYLQYGAAAEDIVFLNKDFTIEFWAYITAAGPKWFCSQRTGYQNNQSMGLLLNSSRKIEIYWGTGAASQAYTTFNTTMNLNTWYHIVLERDNGYLKCFFNGVLDTNKYNIGTTAFYNATSPFRVGGNPENASNTLSGYIDEFRLIMGKAVYTDNFTPPTRALI